MDEYDGVLDACKHNYVQVWRGDSGRKVRVVDCIGKDKMDIIENVFLAAKDMAKTLDRLLLEFDLLVEGGTLPDIRNDVIFSDARAALEAYRKAKGE